MLLSNANAESSARVLLECVAVRAQGVELWVTAKVAERACVRSVALSHFLKARNTRADLDRTHARAYEALI